MSGDLIKYNATKRALAEAHRVDEVKDIHDKAVALRTYAMQAKDRVLIDQAKEIRLRAERRAGELLRDMEKNKGAVPGKTGRKGKPVLDNTPKLSDLNINKSQSSRWQQLANLSNDTFEELVVRAQQTACASIDRPRRSAESKLRKLAKRANREKAASAVTDAQTGELSRVVKPFIGEAVAFTKGLGSNGAPITGAVFAPARRSDVTAPAMAPYSERGHDCYETPPEAVRALLEVEKFSGAIWEPACGSGAIVLALREAGHTVVATDVIDYGCPESRSGVDFLTQREAPEGVTAVITNPPYRHANAFVRHALALVPHVAMLLPLRFLEGQGRSDILDGGQLDRVYVFRNRLPMMHRRGWQGPKATSTLAFAWFTWNRNHKGRPATLLHRISWTSPMTSPAPVEDSGIPIFLRRAPS
jgi:hypothetical protein